MFCPSPGDLLDHALRGAARCMAWRLAGGCWRLEGGAGHCDLNCSGAAGWAGPAWAGLLCAVQPSVEAREQAAGQSSSSSSSSGPKPGCGNKITTTNNAGAWSPWPCRGPLASARSGVPVLPGPGQPGSAPGHWPPALNAVFDCTSPKQGTESRDRARRAGAAGVAA